MKKNKPTILHLANDEKFIDSGFDLFEDILPGHNECFILTDEEEIRLIKTTPYRVIKFEDISSQVFIDTLNKYDLIVFHSLDYCKLEVLRCMSKHKLSVWIGFGYDYYDLIAKEKTDLFDMLTKRLFLHHEKTGAFSNRDVRHITVRLLSKFKHWIIRTKSKEDLINKITYFAPVLNEEYLMIKKVMGDYFTPNFVDWNYGQIEYNLRERYNNVHIRSNNILVGNSANYENNHLEVFNILKHLDVNDRKILTPLSYGREIYRDVIIDEGVRLFGDDFVPLVEFMPIEEYIQQISTCSIVIMNHIRQQALGNIHIMIYLGATVFLKQVNPIYKIYKKIGIVVFSIEELEANPEVLHFRLDEETIAMNRKLIQENWFRDTARKKTKKLLETVLKISI